MGVECLNDCSGNGKCSNNKCECDSGFKGDDCSDGIVYLREKKEEADVWSSVVLKMKVLDT